MSNMLKVAEEIEEKLKKVSLVGPRIGSGFSFIGNSRDVQFYYTPGIVENIKTTTKNYRKNIEKIANEVISKYDDLEVSFTYRLDNFSFYISPKREKVKYEEEEAFDEVCCEEDGAVGSSINSLNLYGNRAKILLNVVNYGLAHMTFTADDLGELSGIQEELMKYTEKDK